MIQVDIEKEILPDLHFFGPGFTQNAIDFPCFPFYTSIPQTGGLRNRFLSAERPWCCGRRYDSLSIELVQAKEQGVQLSIPKNKKL